MNSIHLPSSDPPPVEDVRPTRCPHCGGPARHDGDLLLWGHGCSLVGVVVLVDDLAVLVDSWVRRFLCRACRRTFSVRPEGVLPRRLYALPVILTAWLLATPPPLGEGLDDEQVCARLGVDLHVGREAGHSGCLRWRTLARWAHRIPDLWPSRPVVGSSWRQRVGTFLAGFLGDGGRGGVIRRALTAHTAGGGPM